MCLLSSYSRLIYIGLALIMSPQLPADDTGTSENAAKRLITVDDQFALKAVASPAFSPDGKWIAYTVSTDNFEEDTSLERIWMISPQGGSPIPMTSALVSSSEPVFSRDSKTLYFLSARGEQKSQLWSLNLVAGGEGQQVTEIERGVKQINFSPDETRLLLVYRGQNSSTR